MSIDYQKLQTEISTDPAGLGYAGKADAEKAALGNALTAPGAAQVSPAKLTSDTVRKIILPAVQVMASASQAVQAKWQPLLTLIGGATSVDNDAEFQATMAALVADFSTLNPGMTQARVDSYTKRTGSRFEAVGVFGVLTDTAQAVSERDIGIARNGQ